MGKLNINNPRVNNSGLFYLPNHTESYKHLDGNHDQANSDSISGFTKKDLMIFIKNLGN
jgi:hypothetical protein